jgi:hypothetical protein
MFSNFVILAGMFSRVLSKIVAFQEVHLSWIKLAKYKFYSSVWPMVNEENLAMLFEHLHGGQKTKH